MHLSLRRAGTARMVPCGGEENSRLWDAGLRTLKSDSSVLPVYRAANCRTPLPENRGTPARSHGHSAGCLPPLRGGSRSPGRLACGKCCLLLSFKTSRWPRVLRTAEPSRVSEPQWVRCSLLRKLLGFSIVIILVRRNSHLGL